MLFNLIFLFSAFEPWGKDADLILKKRPCQERQEGVLVKTAEVLIEFHKNVISEADGPRSHFKPSSSQYTLEAIQKYGFIQGYLLGCDRLMRENSDPWIYPIVETRLNVLKYDPVP